MELSEKDIVQIQQKYSKRLTEEVAKKYNLSLEEAFIKVCKSKTYMLLLDASSYLWQESIPCILHIFESEIHNNYEEFLKYAAKSVDTNKDF